MRMKKSTTLIMMTDVEAKMCTVIKTTVAEYRAVETLFVRNTMKDNKNCFACAKIVCAN